ncbi:MAG: hypothetical protein ACOYOK_11620 [Pseudobdellovibrionaceae bacterium]
MRLAKLEHDGLDWDEGNSAKIETRVSLEVIEDFFKRELLIKEDLRHRFTHKKEEEAYEAEVKKLKENS